MHNLWTAAYISILVRSVCSCTCIFRRFGVGLSFHSFMLILTSLSSEPVSWLLSSLRTSRGLYHPKPPSTRRHLFPQAPPRCARPRGHGRSPLRHPGPGDFGGGNLAGPEAHAPKPEVITILTLKVRSLCCRDKGFLSPESIEP